MSNQANSLKKGLTVKDLVTTGIFSAIFFVFTLIGGLPFAPNPVLTFYMPMGAALLCGPIYLLMVAKVQKRWSVTILGIIMGIIWFATGMHWAFSLGYIGMGIIADLVAGAGHYRNKAINLLSYMLISLGGIYTYVVFFIDPEGWASTMLDNGTEQSYIDTMSASAPSWLLAVIPCAEKSGDPAGGHAPLYPHHSGGLAVHQGRHAAAGRVAFPERAIDPSRHDRRVHLCPADDGGIQGGG